MGRPSPVTPVEPHKLRLVRSGQLGLARLWSLRPLKFLELSPVRSGEFRPARSRDAPGASQDQVGSAVGASQAPVRDPTADFPVDTGVV